MGFTAWAGREEQRGDRAVVRRPLAELERPEAIDGQDLVVALPKLADELISAIRLWREGADLPVAEIADQEVAAEDAKTRRSQRDPSW